MLNLQLFIEGEEVDLFDDESVTLTQTIQNVMDIEKVFTDFSKTFNVPASKVNNKIFKHFHNPFIVGFDARFKKDAELYLNYKLFKKGKIKLEGATRKDNKAHTYKLTFFGSTVSLKDFLGEDKLDNLQFLNDYFSFNYNSTNIKTYMENGLDVTVDSETFTDAIVFPVISHTKRFIYDSGHDSNNVNTDTLNNIAYIADANYNLEINQLKPAIKIHAIIRAIEQQYNLTFSNDFFNDTNLPYYDLYLWMHNKTGSLSSGQINQAFADDYFFRINEGQLEVRPGGLQLVNSKNKSINIVAVPTSNTPFNVVVYQDGQEYARYDNVTLNYNDNTEWALHVQTGSHLQGLVNGFISIAIESETANTFDIRVHVHASPSKKFEKKRDSHLSASASVGTDRKINAARNMPDIKVIDFLTGIFKMFNLTAFMRDDGILEVKTLDSFYTESTKTWDVTEFIDKTSQEINTVLPYKQIDFSYEGLDSFLAKSYHELTKKEWGSLQFNVEKKFDGKIYKVELPFEHFQYERLKDVHTGQNTNVQWGWSADIKQDAYLGEPLLFYPVLKTGLTIGLKDLEGAVSQKTTAYLPSNSISFEDSFNINFGSEFNEYQGVPYNNTLFETYYKNYISEVFDPQKRLLKTKAYLPMSMLMEFSLADKIRIFDVLYRINKITTNFENMQSDLELINAKETFGEKISVVPVVPDRFKPVDTCITIDDDTDLFTYSSYTIDNMCDTDGLEIIAERDLIPDAVSPGNNPKVNDSFEPVAVTSAFIANPSTGTSSTNLLASYYIMQLGKVGEVTQLSEYGIFHSSIASDLSGTTYDQLVASNATRVKFETTELDRRPELPKQVLVQISGLSSGVTVYWKAYVRTNTDAQFATADTIGTIQNGTTT
tara:strand:+ start:4899 stop:7553 length:2655 start_codon:yes stop_codon:yes gene_type:complete